MQDDLFLSYTLFLHYYLLIGTEGKKKQKKALEKQETDSMKENGPTQLFQEFKKKRFTSRCEPLLHILF